jgi:hypothetical protein
MKWLNGLIGFERWSNVCVCLEEWLNGLQWNFRWLPNLMVFSPVVHHFGFLYPYPYALFLILSNHLTLI